MRTFITYDEAGEIVSVMQAEILPAAMDPDVPEVPPVPPGSNQKVVEITADTGMTKRRPLEIHENFRVDVKRGELLRRSPPNEKAEPAEKPEKPAKTGKAAKAQKAEPDGQDE